MAGRNGRIGWACLLLLGLSSLAAGARADEAGPTLRLLTSSQTPPKTYLEGGRPAGYIVEISAEVLRRAGYAPEIDAEPWARAVEEAEAGAGVITGFSRTAERDRKFLYSDIVFEDRVVLVTRRGADFPFGGLADLAGHAIAIQRGSSYGPALDAVLGSFHAVRESGHGEGLKMLAAGRIDGAIVSGGAPAVLFNATAVNLDPRDLVVHEVPISIDPNYIAVARDRPDAAQILERLNRAIATMRQDGAICHIVASYENGF